MNHKRLWRGYREAGLCLKRKKRRHCVRVGSPRPALSGANQEWALDFAHDAIATDRKIRVLSVVDVYTRECLALEVDTGFASRRVTRVLDEVIGKPTQNAHVESFHGRLREECLRVSWFNNLFDARRKVANWKTEYNEQRPHSSLGYRTPAEFARVAITPSYGIDIGRRSLAFPVTPPCIRVRTRRFGRIRRPMCSAMKEGPSDRSKRRAWHKKGLLCG